MTWFRNLNTAPKLLVGFAGAGVVMALIGWMGLYAMAALDANTDDIYTVQLLPSVELASILATAHMVRGEIYAALSAEDRTALRRHLDRIQELTRQNAERRQRVAGAIRAPEVRDAFGRYAELARAYAAYREEQIVKPLLAGRRDLAETAFRQGTARNAAALQALDELITIKLRIARATYDESRAVYSVSRVMVVGFVGGGLALVLVLGWIIARLIARPMGQAVEVLGAVARGDFTRTLDVATKDEVGQMATALNRAVRAMREALLEVKAAAEHATDASRQLSVAADQLAGGAQEQAASLEETAVSLEEITGTVKQNADNARQANQLAVASRDVAAKGGHVVAEAVTAMGEINKASKKIADIIITIDEIAFQTNILALNAAVEAARAGEQGRGFAVVAAEVRNLAQRSTTAAKEIKTLIEDSVGKVDVGAARVNQSGQMLEEIVASVKRVTDIIGEIAAASQEQTAGVDQVNRAVTQMDQVVQGNAAKTEELSSTAQALSAQAEELQALVARFRVEDTGATPASTPARRAPSLPRAGMTTRALRAEPGLVGAASGDGSARAKNSFFEEF